MNIFDPAYLKNEFRTFSFSHFAALAILLVTCIVMIIWLKKIKNKKVNLVFCIVLSVLLIGQEIMRMIWYACINEFNWGFHLPLHLCGMAIILGPIMLLKKNYTLYELIYFWGFGGAIQALLTPDLLYEFPHFRYFQFFVSHGLIIIACVYMTFIEKFRPTWKSIIKVFVITNIYMGIIALVNMITKGNYLFICHKPEQPTILDFLGPWPWYILSLELVGIISFLIYYSPFFIKDMIDKLKKEKKNRDQ